MNEIKKIHLDRQPFTISAPAHRELRAYLDAIERQVGPKGQDVLKEIELRMAELLGERGVAADKVILAEDVEFLKEQLGKPGDFKDEAASDAHSQEGSDKTTGEMHGAPWSRADGDDHDDDSQSPKRLYRDTENAMIAGIAAGLAAYFRIDPLIVRLIFVVLMFTGGAGIIAYILLWILVPEAKTPSERLQMRGKAVTVDNIKRLVDRADLPAAANRAGTLLGRILTRIAKLFLAIIGVGFVTAGMAAVVWSCISAIYLLLHGGQVGTESIFPVGTREVVLLISGLVTAAMTGLMLTLAGIAMITRKWRVPAWSTASIIGLFLTGATVGTALAFDAAPAIRQRYRDAHKVQTRSLTEFKNIELRGDDTHYIFKPSDGYSVRIAHVGKLDDKNVRTKIDGDTLKIDTSGFDAQRFCSGLCFYNDKDLEVTIYAPAAEHVTLVGADASFESPEMLKQSNMIIESRKNNSVHLGYMNPVEASLSIKDRDEASRVLQLQDIRSRDAASDDSIFVGEESTRIKSVEKLSVEVPRTCDSADPIVLVNDAPKMLRINGLDVITSVSALHTLQDSDKSNDYNCVAVYN